MACERETMRGDAEEELLTRCAIATLLSIRYALLFFLVFLFLVFLQYYFFCFINAVCCCVLCAYSSMKILKTNP